MTKDEALKMAIEAMEDAYSNSTYWEAAMSQEEFLKRLHACKEALKQPLTRDWKETIDERIAKDDAFKQALEQPAQEPVACPYPCGWNNLLAITTKKGAYLVTHFDADNRMPYSYWQEISSMVDTARTMVKWAMQLKTHPAPSWQGLSDDEIEEIIVGKNGTYFNFARAIEQALKEKNNAL